MSLPRDLIEQAKHLAKKEPRRPRQASLRRAVSGAYYAVFHLLIGEAASRLTPTKPSGLKKRLQRAFTHRDMKKVCVAFSNSNTNTNFPYQFGKSTVPSDLVEVSRIFVALQEARHLADYDLSDSINRSEVLRLIGEAEDALNRWQRVRSDPYTNVFLYALLLGDKIKSS